MTEVAQKPLLDKVGKQDSAIIRVLHVDDDSQSLIISKEILETLGPIKVDNAHSVEEAYTKLSQTQYDVIVSDHQIPGKDGLTFLTELRERKIRIPFILFTIKGLEEVAITALNLGADGYYNKQGEIETVYGELYHGIKVAAERYRTKVRLESELQKLNRSLKALAKSNQALSHATDELKYARKVCDIIVHDCGYKLAWAGFADNNKDKTITPFAYAGLDKEYIQKLDLTWADSERGNGPTGKAIRTGQYQVCNVITDPHYSSWREDALKRGYASSIALPLISDRKPFGALIIYSKESEFSTDEIALLSEVASDFAHGLSTLRLREAGARANELLQMNASLIDLTPNPIIVKNLDGTITFWSKGAERLYGYSKEEAIGKDAHLLLKTRYSVTILDMAKQFSTQGAWSGTLMQQTKSGLPVIVQSHWLANHNVYSKTTDILETDVDITALKSTEQKLQESYKKLEVMNEKLRVVGGLARHDVANKLATIQGNVHLARKKISSGEDASLYLDKIDSSIEKIGDVFSFARAYEKIGVEKLTIVNVEKSLQEALSLFAEPPNIQIEYACNNCQIIADSSFSSVLYNLIDNSLRHGKKVTKIKIRCEAKTDEQHLIYEDNGVGIPDPVRSHLFQEGYSTSGGTGYGLYLISKIVDFYGWKISEEGQRGQGVRFIIKMPTQLKS